MPAHTHPAASGVATTDRATGSIPAVGGRFASAAGASDNGPHNNLSPYLGLSYIIALQGIFPARP
jgi:microcystin-dependent protein